MVELAAAPTQVFILHNPTSLRRAGAVLHAVQRYYPTLVIRRYVLQGSDGRPQLLPVESNNGGRRPVVDEGAASRDVPADSPGNGPEAPPRLRLSTVAQVEPPLISAEELAMLLGPVPSESEAGESENGL